jgi:hypothetical protein
MQVYASLGSGVNLKAQNLKALNLLLS